jgi:hypothetical protein
MALDQARPSADPQRGAVGRGRAVAQDYEVTSVELSQEQGAGTTVQLVADVTAQLKPQGTQVEVQVPWSDNVVADVAQAIEAQVSRVQAIFNL